MPSASQRVYRRNAHRYVLTVVYIELAAIPIVVAFLANPVIAAFAFPFLLLAWRTFRLAVVVDDDGVTVRNVMRDRRIPWERIVRFDWGTWGGFPIGGAHLDDGTFVRASALNPPAEFRRGQNQAVPRALVGLNEELARARARGGHGSSEAATGDPARLSLEQP